MTILQTKVEQEVTIKNAFELKPLLVAGIIGGLAFYIYEMVSSSDGVVTDFAVGFGIGAAVQIGVRLTGVS